MKSDFPLVDFKNMEIKRAYEKGFDWVWCMDDDTIAQKNSLEELVKATKKLQKNEKDYK